MAPCSSAKLDEFRAVFETSLKDIAARTDSNTRCLILSGGVDTCAILEAASAIGVTFEAAVTVVVAADDKAPDAAFATAAAQQHGLHHHIVRLAPQDLIQEYLKPCIRELYTFDGMTLRNSLVVAAAFHKVAELGFKDAIVGDGADELFGGYSFTWKTEDPEEWKEKRDAMCRKWTFATEALANMYGLKSHSPYMEPDFVKWAVENTTREDCIGERPIQLVYGGDYQDHVTGKMILREAYKTVSSWRRKDPIEVGSGITVIGHDDYWEDTISDKEFEAETLSFLERGFVICTKENLVNFRAFESCFGGDSRTIELPNIKRMDLGSGCKGCCFDIGDGTFCHVCGAYPAQRG